jgi:transposase
MKKSIGIDVSMNTLDVSIFDGNLFKSKKYENSYKGFSDIEKELLNFSKGEKIISMEATGVYHLKAAVNFTEKGYVVSVINPLIIKRYGEMKMLRAKTDPVDARTIAEYGFNEKPCKFIRKINRRERITQLLKQIDSLHEMQTQNRNRIHALNRNPDVDEKALTIYMELGEYLKSKTCEAEKRIQEILKEFYCDENKRLLKIPGVGKRISSLVIGFFGEFENFENAKQVSSFIGLNPSPKQSGISLNRGGSISKKGNSYMRKIFYMAALSASVHNTVCKKQYERLLAHGKNKKVALIAVANKLLRQIFAIVKYKRIYDINYKKMICTVDI